MSEKIDQLIELLLEERLAAKKQEIPESIKVTQINVGDNSYFCQTSEEERIFFDRHPEAKKYKCNDCRKLFDTPATRESLLVCPHCASTLIQVHTETFHYELPDFIADGYLNDPENKREFEKIQFSRKDKNA